MEINIEECEAAGLDPVEVEKIARGLSEYAKQAQALGICVYGGSGSGSGDLRFDDGTGRPLVVADLDGLFDGGEGACPPNGQGLIRGE